MLKGTTATRDVDAIVDPRLYLTEYGKERFTTTLRELPMASITRGALISLARYVERVLERIAFECDLVVDDSPHLTTKPQWEHGYSCTFLGNRLDQDLYYCDQRKVIPTLIARYGSEGPEYCSGTALAVYDAHIWAAAVLAESRGLGTFMKSHHMITIDGEDCS
jgi:hypothetical protein